VKTRKIFLPPIPAETQRPKSRMQFDQSGLGATHTANISKFSDSQNASKNLENMCNYASIF